MHHIDKQIAENEFKEDGKLCVCMKSGVFNDTVKELRQFGYETIESKHPSIGWKSVRFDPISSDTHGYRIKKCHMDRVTDSHVDIDRMMREAVRMHDLSHVSHVIKEKSGAAILTENGNIYAGCNVHGYSNISAVQSAIAAMIAADEIRIKSVALVHDKYDTQMNYHDAQELKEFGGDVTAYCKSPDSGIVEVHAVQKC